MGQTKSSHAGLGHFLKEIHRPPVLYMTTIPKIFYEIRSTYHLYSQ
jgi:hypothetical protein